MEIDQQRGGWQDDRAVLALVAGAALVVLAGIAILFGAGVRGSDPLHVAHGELGPVAASVADPGAQGWGWLARAVSNLHPGHALGFISNLADRIASSPLFAMESAPSSSGGRGVLSPISDPMTLLVIAVLLLWAGWGEAKRMRKLMRVRRK